jgi:hypothetical protein
MRGGSDKNHCVAALSNAIMWLVLTRAPLPDAPYWPGRRLLALGDAIAWPAGWIALATHLPQPIGIVGPMVTALAVLCAIGRAHRAVCQNHRYHFATWRSARTLAVLLLLGGALKVALSL